MEKYYINGKKATKKEYQLQEKKNSEIMQLRDREAWLKAMTAAAFLTKF